MVCGWTLSWSRSDGSAREWSFCGTPPVPAPNQPLHLTGGARRLSQTCSSLVPRRQVSLVGQVRICGRPRGQPLGPPGGGIEVPPGSARSQLVSSSPVGNAYYGYESAALS